MASLATQEDASSFNAMAPRCRRRTLRCAAAALIATTLFALCSAHAAGDEPRKLEPGTPQLADALRPLDDIPGTLRVHAVVATLPDPVETRQGRSFDMTLAAGIAAFQAHGYVLDGFVLQWPHADRGKEDDAKPAKDDEAEEKKESKQDEPARRDYRKRPGLLVFRRDNWRREGAKYDAEYFLVFVVGESPSYGIQPEAFDVAARCVIRLHGLTTAPRYDKPDAKPSVPDCTRLDSPAAVKQAAASEQSPGTPAHANDMTCMSEQSTSADCPPTRVPQLDVIGPSFSGSMNSLLAATRTLCKEPDECNDLHVLMLSPATTAPSNTEITNQAINLLPLPASDASIRDVQAKKGKEGTAIEPRRPNPLFPAYVTLTIGLDGQAQELHKWLCMNQPRGHASIPIAVLAEESTYGDEMLRIASRALEKPCEGEVASRVRVTAGQFPQSIASIRTEQALLGRAQKSQRRNLIPGASRLLEFNLDAMDEAIDRPTAYQPEVSSRSDELMIYRTLDAMRLYVQPQAVVIIATEIRDRLFLLSEVRGQLPTAIPVLFEMDYLMVHPDYRKATRGTVVVPSADPLVCMSKEEARMVACGGSGVHYHAFPSDYAANAFRAVSILVEHADLDRRYSRPVANFAQTAAKQFETQLPDATRPRIYVATLAGFQGLDNAKLGRFTLAAADTRVMAQKPAYVGLAALSVFTLMVGFWLLTGPLEGRWVLSLGRQMVNDLPFGRSRTSKGKHYLDLDQSLAPRAQERWAVSLLAFSMIAAVLVFVQLPALFSAGPPTHDFNLPHGRDRVAIISIWLLYGCVAVVGLARILVLDRRLIPAIQTLCPDHLRGHYEGWSGGRYAWFVPVCVFVFGMFLLWYPVRPRVSVDPTWPWLIALMVLTLGVVFLTELIRQHRLQRRLSMSLIRVAGPVRKHLDGPWPSYLATGEPPCTPFNLRLRRVMDFETLVATPHRDWLSQTRAIIDGERPNPLTMDTFEPWQARLVSELKLLATSIRTTAWCAMLAPVTVLLAINLYPPVREQFLTGVCIALLLGSFAMSVFVVLRMEGDPMYGAMFTRDGDSLTFGGGLRALWPKFVAMGLVLLPLIAPDMWRWLHNMLRSMNTIQ